MTELLPTKDLVSTRPPFQV